MMKKILLLILITIIVLLLCACSADWFLGEGRGDWTLDLSNGYCISKINSKQIWLIHKNNPEDSGGSIVIPNYFVLSYQQCDSYICFEGICTKERYVSDEELKSGIRSYYLIDTVNSILQGPFESFSDFLEQCESLDLPVENDWIDLTS